MSGHLDGPPPGPPDPPYIPGDLGAPSAEEFARRRASSEPRPAATEVRAAIEGLLRNIATPDSPVVASVSDRETDVAKARDVLARLGAAPSSEPRPENPHDPMDGENAYWRAVGWDEGFASRQPEIDRLEAERDEATRQREQAATSRNVIAEQRDKAAEGRRLSRVVWRCSAAHSSSDLREDQGYPDGTFVSPIAGDPPIKPFPTEHIEYRVVGPRWQGSVYQHRNYAEDERRCMIDPARYRIEQRTVTTGDWTPSEKPETP